MPPMAVSDNYGDGGLVQTHRTVTRYRVSRPNDSFSSQDSVAERDNFVEVDQEPPQRRSEDWERYTRSSDHLPEQRMVVRHRPEVAGALVTRPDRYYDDDELYRRRRWEEDRRRHQGGAYYQGAVVRRRDSYDEDSASSSESDREERKKHHKDDRVRHGRHVAEGALVGAVGAELLRKSQGAKKNKNRNRDVAAGAILGGGVIEAISRARSHNRSSHSPERRGRRRSDEHERRSSSHEKYKKLAEYAAGAVAVGAIANYALKKRRQSTGRRSKSRSKSRSRSRSRGRHSKKEEEEKKKKLAAAGLGTAAIVAAGAAYARSRSRKRSKSRPGSPGSHHSNGQELLEKAKEHKGALAVAGLGAAGLAAYAQKKHQEAEAKKSRSRSHSRKRSDSRQSNAYDSDGEMVAYGSDPVPVDDGRSHSGRRSRSRSQSRTRNRRPSMSDKIKGTAEGLIAAGAGAFGANELRKKYEERKAEREEEEVPVENHRHGHDRQDRQDDYQNDGFYGDEQPLYSPPASGVYSVHDPYAPQSNSRTAAYNPTPRDHRDNHYGGRDEYDGPTSAEDVSKPAFHTGVMNPPPKRVSFESEDVSDDPPRSAESSVEELPQRFDSHGKKVHSDSPGEELLYKIGETIEDITSGKGSVGKIFSSLSSKFYDLDGRKH